MAKGKIEKYVDKIVGRYFLGFAVATILLCFKIIDNNTWIWVAGFFFAGGIAKKIVDGKDNGN